MTAFGWVLIGAVIGAGHWAASALPVIGAGCLALTVPVAAVTGTAMWASRREERLEQTAAGGLPDDTAPLTAYETAVPAAIENGGLYDGTYDDQRGGE